ncbi:Uncharacterized protein Adt_38665 [Abeliophyllum distichum]|uniref:Uncharacterized protein n=1 Tax=Abeliophyllum distichum TaxID=126358 RepID=A0ABD1Q5V9_9LAMI
MPLLSFYSLMDGWRRKGSYGATSTSSVVLSHVLDWNQSLLHKIVEEDFVLNYSKSEIKRCSFAFIVSDSCCLPNFQLPSTVKSEYIGKILVVYIAISKKSDSIAFAFIVSDSCCLPNFQLPSTVKSEYIGKILVVYIAISKKSDLKKKLTMILLRSKKI